MSEPFNPSRSLTALEQDSTVIAVIEMSQSKWLVAAVIPDVERPPLKKIDPNEEMRNRSPSPVAASVASCPLMRTGNHDSPTKGIAKANCKVPPQESASCVVFLESSQHLIR
jgi:hypothetical protein